MNIKISSSKSCEYNSNFSDFEVFTAVCANLIRARQLLILLMLPVT